MSAFFAAICSYKLWAVQLPKRCRQAQPEPSYLAESNSAQQHLSRAWIGGKHGHQSQAQEISAMLRAKAHGCAKPTLARFSYSSHGDQDGWA
eukprot:5670033-Amphidinium_carterae.1